MQYYFIDKNLIIKQKNERNISHHMSVRTSMSRNVPSTCCSVLVKRNFFTNIDVFASSAVLFCHFVLPIFNTTITSGSGT